MLQERVRSFSLRITTLAFDGLFLPTVVETLPPDNCLSAEITDFASLFCYFPTDYYKIVAAIVATAIETYAAVVTSIAVEYYARITKLEDNMTQLYF